DPAAEFGVAGESAEELGGGPVVVGADGTIELVAQGRGAVVQVVRGARSVVDRPRPVDGFGGASGVCGHVFTVAGERRVIMTVWLTEPLSSCVTGSPSGTRRTSSPVGSTSTSPISVV